jgi:uncharacterized SAM-binding protein YcdF (DUF218 family)
MTGLQTRNEEPKADGHAARPHRPWLRRGLAAAGTLLVVCVVGSTLAFAGGFVWFLRYVPDQELRLGRDADGIVVLTGGTSRIADAVELLAAGHGKRLLITGAHPATTSREITRLMPRYERWIGCCVDLDHSAMNTFGNAAETRRWLKSRSFESLIVVTSNYHMPRAMAELGHAVPDVELIPHPVVSDKLRAEPWWQSPATVKLLLSEYVKYTVVKIRTRFDPAPDSAGAVRSART